MRIVALFMLFLGLPWICYTSWITVQYMRLKRAVKGMEQPELLLTRRERRARARRKLQRKDDAENDAYMQQLIDKTMRSTLERGEERYT